MKHFSYFWNIIEISEVFWVFEKHFEYLKRTLQKNLRYFGKTWDASKEFEMLQNCKCHRSNENSVGLFTIFGCFLNPFRIFVPFFGTLETLQRFQNFHKHFQYLKCVYNATEELEMLQETLTCWKNTSNATLSKTMKASEAFRIFRRHLECFKNT